MTFGLAVTVFATSILVILLVIVVHKKRPKRLKQKKYVSDWRNVQDFCKDKETWPEALVDADRLLDKALKRRRYKGKSMGERIVSAQHDLTDNDGVWYAHKLVKSIKTTQNQRLHQKQVKKALIAFRQSLKDLGAV